MMKKTQYESISRDLLSNLPAPDDSWDSIYIFLDIHSQEIDSYGYTDNQRDHEKFLEGKEDKFNETGNVEGDLREVLALIYLVYRRHRWQDEFSGASPERYRPFVSALLQRAHNLLPSLRL